MARALAQERWCSDGFFPSFPELPPDSPARQAYVAIFGQTEYEKYQSVDRSTVDTARQDENVSQEPRHDAESFYWIIVVSLLLSRPRGAPDDQDTTHAALSKIWEKLYRHQVPNEGDERDTIMDRLPKQWKRWLHPGLHSMAPFLAKLSTQFRPEYHLLEPKSPNINERDMQEEAIPMEHLHEVMRRLLLEEIMRLELEPLLLDPNNNRKPSVELVDGAGNDDILPRKTSSKRKLEQRARIPADEEIKRRRSSRTSN